ncbi:Cation/H(+) antiporter 18 [Capsicum chinense]|nr:Cation/H(+) antiporter 18 [Capsicum chinense]
MGSSCSSHSYGVFWEDCWHYCGITSVQIARPRGCNYRFLDEHQRFGGAHCSNIAKDRGVLNDQTFAIMVLMALFTTSRNIPGMLNLTNVSQGIEKREVGILVDRGLGGASQVSSSNVDFSVTALFFGGHDDREALAYGVRIAEHPGISLVVVRFIVDPEVNGTSVKVEMNNSFIPEAQSDDEEFLANVKQKSYIDGSIKYEERIVKNARGTIEAIREYNLCNLFLVRRMPKGQVVVALDKKSDCPELGSLGNLLTLPECSTTTSVLVVQQYRSQLPQESPSSLKEESSDADCDSE